MPNRRRIIGNWFLLEHARGILDVPVSSKTSSILENAQHKRTKQEDRCMRRKCTTHTYLCAFALYQSSISLSLLRTLLFACRTLSCADLSPDFARSISEEDGGCKGKGGRRKGGRLLIYTRHPAPSYPVCVPCVFSMSYGSCG